MRVYSLTISRLKKNHLNKTIGIIWVPVEILQYQSSLSMNFTEGPNTGYYLFNSFMRLIDKIKIT